MGRHAGRVPLVLGRRHCPGVGGWGTFLAQGRGSEAVKTQRPESPRALGEESHPGWLESRVRGLGGPNIVHSGYCNKIPGWVPCKQQTFLSPSPRGWKSEIQVPACSDEDLLPGRRCGGESLFLFFFFFLTLLRYNLWGIFYDSTDPIQENPILTT